MASDAMIMYSTRMTQPSKRMVTFTPITAMPTTSRQITVATTQVSGLLLVWPGATSDSTVDPIRVMLPMFKVSAVISTRIPTANPMMGDSPRATHSTGAAAEACQLFSRWLRTTRSSSPPVTQATLGWLVNRAAP